MTSPADARRYRHVPPGLGLWLGERLFRTLGFGGLVGMIVLPLSDESIGQVLIMGLSLLTLAGHLRRTAQEIRAGHHDLWVRPGSVTVGGRRFRSADLRSVAGGTVVLGEGSGTQRLWARDYPEAPDLAAVVQGALLMPEGPEPAPEPSRRPRLRAPLSIRAGRAAYAVALLSQLLRA